jgi:exonuclease SbcC
VTLADEETQTATTAHQTEAPLRELLAQVEAAALHKPVLVAADDAETDHTKAADARVARVAEAGKAKQFHDSAKIALALKEDAFQQTFSTREAARPEITAATRLDLTIDTNGKQCVAFLEAEQDAAGKLGNAQQELVGLQETLEETERLAAERAIWLSEHASSATLVNSWSRAEPALTRYAQASTDRKTAEEARSACVVAQDQALSAHTNAKNAVTAAEKSLLAAKKAWEVADDEAQRAAVPAETRDEGEQLVQRLQNAGKLAPIIEEVAAQQKLAKRENRNAAVARTKAKAASDEEKTLREEVVRQKAILEEAMHAEQMARSTLDLEGHRAELREDEPCPLCGAKEHPYAQNIPLASLITKAAKRVTTLHEKYDQLKERRTTCRTGAAAEKASAEEADQRETEALEKIAKLQKRWRKETAAFGVEAGEPDTAGQKVVEAAIVAAEVRRDAIQTATDRALALATKARTRQVTRDGCQKSFEETSRGLTTAATCLSDANQKLNNCDAQTAQAERDSERAVIDIAPAFAGREGWRAALDASPSMFETTCTTEVTTYRDKIAQQANDTKAITELNAKRGVALATVTERESVAGKCATARAAADIDLTRLQEERAKLLAGRPTNEVQDLLDAQVTKADSERTAALTAEHLQAQRAVAAATEENVATKTLEERTLILTRTQAELTAALEQAGMDLPTLRDRLARPQAWIEEARARLTALDTALTNAHTILGERTRARDEHEGKDAPSLTEDEARDRLEPAALADKSAIELHAGARERRRTDDDARKAVQGKAAELELRRKDAEHWQKMDSLIGSSDGKKLRVFAQSLTLEALMSHANEHLDSFAPRYRIMRVPEQDLDLQIIDQDMGDEVRSVNSLSGGESFLVSLALALGLSSLAAKDVRVETLFIDEGFGTLDPETLDIALAALDALQSAGRKIGLISHVSGLADQIGAQVQIRKRGGGRSEIVIEGTSSTGTAATEKARSPTRARKKPSSASEPTAT